MIGIRSFPGHINYFMGALGLYDDSSIKATAMAILVTVEKNKIKNSIKLDFQLIKYVPWLEGKGSQVLVDFYLPKTSLVLHLIYLAW